MRLTSAIAAASLFAAIAAPLAAKPPVTTPPTTPACQDVLSSGESTWMADPGAELGKLDGLLNGSFYLKYEDDTKAAVKATPPNMVIKTNDGDLQLWLAGESVMGGDGSWLRKLVAVAVEGGGVYAGAKVDLVLEGSFVPEKGGSYQLIGTICGGDKR